LKGITRGLTNDNLITPEDTIGDYASRVRASGIWITNSDGTGAKLIDEAGFAVMEKGPGGTPIQVQRTWDDITGEIQPTQSVFGDALSIK
jgi:hypothetical protein